MLMESCYFSEHNFKSSLYTVSGIVPCHKFLSIELCHQVLTWVLSSIVMKRQMPLHTHILKFQHLHSYFRAKNPISPTMYQHSTAISSSIIFLSKNKNSHFSNILPINKKYSYENNINTNSNSVLTSVNNITSISIHTSM